VWAGLSVETILHTSEEFIGDKRIVIAEHSILARHDPTCIERVG
jgi:hypothetical protein